MNSASGPFWLRLAPSLLLGAIIGVGGVALGVAFEKSRTAKQRHYQAGLVEIQTALLKNYAEKDELVDSLLTNLKQYEVRPESASSPAPVNPREIGAISHEIKLIQMVIDTQRITLRSIEAIQGR